MRAKQQIGAIANRRPNLATEIFRPAKRVQIWLATIKNTVRASRIKFDSGKAITDITGGSFGAGGLIGGC